MTETTRVLTALVERQQLQTDATSALMRTATLLIEKQGAKLLRLRALAAQVREAKTDMELRLAASLLVAAVEERP